MLNTDSPFLQELVSSKLMVTQAHHGESTNHLCEVYHPDGNTTLITDYYALFSDITSPKTNELWPLVESALKRAYGDDIRIEYNPGYHANREAIL